MNISASSKIHKTRLDTYIKHIFKKKTTFSYKKVVTKVKKDLRQQDERYRIIGHIRCRTKKNLAIHSNGNMESCLLRTVSCHHVVRLNGSFVQESLSLTINTMMQISTHFCYKLLLIL